MKKHFYFIIITLVGCNKFYSPVTTNASHVTTNKATANSSSDKLISTYKFKVDSITNIVIAKSDSVFTKDNYPSTLGNFCCDALHFISKEKCSLTPDLVILNKGGLRINLPKGDIKVKTIFELMPFENELVVCKVRGEDILKSLPTLLEKKAAFFGFQITESKEKQVTCKINNQTINPNQIYLIATSDYLATGGDNYTMFQNSNFTNCKIKIRDAFIDYCKHFTNQNKSIKPYSDERYKTIN